MSAIRGFTIAPLGHLAVRDRHRDKHKSNANDEEQKSDNVELPEDVERLLLEGGGDDDGTDHVALLLVVADFGIRSVLVSPSADDEDQDNRRREGRCHDGEHADSPTPSPATIGEREAPRTPRGNSRGGEDARSNISRNPDVDGSRKGGEDGPEQPVAKTLRVEASARLKLKELSEGGAH